MSSCRKDASEIKGSSMVRDNSEADNGNKIRLTEISGDFGTETFTYNENGLVSIWGASQLGSEAHHEYNEKGMLTTSWVYFSGVLTYKIDFFYDQNRIVREVWYNGNTSDIVDEVIYSYNNNNMPSHAESPVLGYRIDYKFSPQGNLLEFLYYEGGTLVAKGEYTYGHHLKNPNLALPGMEHGYLFVNSFYYSNKWYSTSLRFILYDAEGNIIFDSPQDPTKTVAVPGPENYLLTTSFYDITSASFTHLTFTYENCGQCGDKQSSKLWETNNKQRSAELILVKGSRKVLHQRLVR